MLERPRPRFVVPRVLKNGETAFYFVLSKYSQTRLHDPQ
jgi:hypothetical protein